MKKFILTAVLLTITAWSSYGMEIKLFNAVKKTSPVKQTAFTADGEICRLLFRLAPDAPADFAINSIYIFADQDRNTGRKGIGNEYYFDLTKAMISTYTADGKGTLHRKAVTAQRDGEWYTVTFPAKLCAGNPLQEFEVVFHTTKGKSDRSILRGNAAETIELPAAK